MNQSCECIKDLNEQLKERGLEIACNLILTKSDQLRPKIELQTTGLRKIQKKPTVSLVASFCPFCGRKYAE